MSCWSFGSPLSFMIAVGREPQAATAGMAETHLHYGHLLRSLFRLRCCLTTRNQQRACRPSADQEAGPGGPGRLRPAPVLPPPPVLAPPPALCPLHLGELDASTQDATPPRTLALQLQRLLLVLRLSVSTSGHRSEHLDLLPA